MPHTSARSTLVASKNYHEAFSTLETSKNYNEGGKHVRFLLPSSVLQALWECLASFKCAARLLVVFC
jgi:hypothetical protein